MTYMMANDDYGFTGPDDRNRQAPDWKFAENPLPAPKAYRQISLTPWMIFPPVLVALMTALFWNDVIAAASSMPYLPQNRPVVVAFTGFLHGLFTPTSLIAEHVGDFNTVIYADGYGYGYMGGYIVGILVLGYTLYALYRMLLKLTLWIANW